MKYITGIRTILWGCLAVVMIILFWLKFVPTGHISYTHDLEGEHDFISNITPAERVTEKEGRVEITGDPAYFTLRTPRSFNTATVTLKYKFPDKAAEVMELGILADSSNWRYRLKPVENKIIDQLLPAWDKIKDNDSILLQREKQYSSLKEFLDHPPPLEEIGLYNYDWEEGYYLADYKPAEEDSHIGTPLRGAFQFYTYVKDEPLEVEFKFWDVNENEERDDFRINLYHQDKLVDSKNIQGDGVEEDTEEINSLGTTGFDLQGLAEGVYKVGVHANDDIITERIVSGQNKLSFIGELRLAKLDIPKMDLESFYPLKLYTDSAQLHAKTIYPSSLQSLAINEGDKGELEIKDTYKQFSKEVKSGSGKPLSVSVEEPGVILSGDGVFSFSSESLFNPGFAKLRAERTLDEQIKYVLADYQSPVQKRDWKVKQVRFDLSSSYSEDGKYKFLISVPELKKDDGMDDEVVIDEIKVELSGDTIPEILMRKLKIKN